MTQRAHAVSGEADERSLTLAPVDSDPAVRPIDDEQSNVDSRTNDAGVVIDLRSGEVTIDVAEHSTELESGRRLDPQAGLLAASPAMLTAKRAIDIAGSAILLLALLPLLLMVALLVRITSPGPVLYVSTRVGKNGETFRFLKFRSMATDAEHLKGQLSDLNEMGGPVFKMKQDPRITPVGRWIRKYSIDELPQLVNVLRGDMSLVGPRPPTCDEVEQYLPHERQRLLVRPGLTCFWQVQGRSEIDFDDWVDLDLDYIEEWSPLLDLKLLFLTIPAVVTARGAY